MTMQRQRYRRHAWVPPQRQSASFMFCCGEFELERDLRERADNIRPSTATNPPASSAIPTKCLRSNRSPRTVTPSRIAVTGISKVTSIELFAPAEARMRNGEIQQSRHEEVGPQDQVAGDFHPHRPHEQIQGKRRKSHAQRHRGKGR